MKFLPRELVGILRPNSYISLESALAEWGISTAKSIQPDVRHNRLSSQISDAKRSHCLSPRRRTFVLGLPGKTDPPRFLQDCGTGEGAFGLDLLAATGGIACGTRRAESEGDGQKEASQLCIQIPDSRPANAPVSFVKRRVAWMFETLHSAVLCYRRAKRQDLILLAASGRDVQS
jgi:hypothetical protein